MVIYPLVTGIDVSDKSRQSTLVHERAHKADRSKLLKGIMEESLGNFIRRQNSDLGENSSYLYNEDLEYLRDFSERQTRHRSAQFWLQNKMPGFNFKQPITQKEYEFLIKNKSKIPSDVKQLLNLYGDRDNFIKYINRFQKGGQHGGLDRWFAEKWVDVKTGKACGRSGSDKDGRPYPACRPSKRISSKTPKTSPEMSSQEKAKFKATKTSSQRIPYNHKRNK